MLSLGAPLNLGKRLKSIDPHLVVELLLPDTPDARRDELAAHLVSERKRVEQLERDVYERVMSEADGLRSGPGVLIHPVESPDDDLAELEGPLASKLTYATGRPTLALRHYPDLVAFSGRAAGTFSFASFIGDAGLRRVVMNMGGHAKAMGGAFKLERLDDFIVAVRAWEKSTQDQAIWADTTEPGVPAYPLTKLSPQIAYMLACGLGPFGHHFRRPAYRATLAVRDGCVYGQDVIVHTNVALPDGTHQVTFTFDETQCDGELVGINVLSV